MVILSYGLVSLLKIDLINQKAVMYDKNLASEGTKSVRLIPQGTVDNNLGPDRLAGPKGLDPNFC